MNISRRGFTLIILISSFSISGIAQSQLDSTKNDIPLPLALDIESSEKLLLPNNVGTKDANEKSKSSKGKESIPDTIRTKNETISGIVLGFAPSETGTPTAVVYWSGVANRTTSIPLDQIVDITDGESGQIIDPYADPNKGVIELSPNQEYRLFLSPKNTMGKMRVIAVSEQYLTVQEKHSPDTIHIELGSLIGIKDEFYLQQKQGSLVKSMVTFAIPGAVVAAVGLAFGGDLSIIAAAFGGAGGAAVGLVVGLLRSAINYDKHTYLFEHIDKYTNEEKRILIQTHILDKQNP